MKEQRGGIPLQVYKLPVPNQNHKCCTLYIWLVEACCHHPTPLWSVNKHIHKNLYFILACCFVLRKRQHII